MIQALGGVENILEHTYSKQHIILLGKDCSGRNQMDMKKV